MATWTDQKRKETPLKSFGDPATRGFPIEDQEDVDNAAKAIGRANNPDAVKKRLKRIIKRLGLTVPPSWEEDKAAMGAEELSDDDIRSSLIDALGDRYPSSPYQWNGIWICDVFQGTKKVVFNYNDDTWELGFELDDSGTATLVGDPVNVARRTVYVPETDADDKAAMGAAVGRFEITAFGADVGDFVPWRSKIFTCGSYPVQGVEADPSYLDKIVSNFNAGGVKLKNAHGADPQSLFSKIELGDCKRIWREGHDLMGEGSVHQVVRDLFGNPPASIEILSKDTNPRLGAIALLNVPQVEDARVVAAFAAFEGRRHSKSDQDLVQAIHDHAASLGATCAAEMGGRHSKSDSEDIQQLHDLAVKQGATCPAAAAMGSVDDGNNSAPASKAPAREKQMHPLITGLRALFGKKPEALKAAGLTDEDVAKINSDDPEQHAQFMASLPTEVNDGAAAEAKAKADAEAKSTADFEAETAKRLEAMQAEIDAGNARFQGTCSRSLEDKAAEFAKRFTRKDSKGCVRLLPKQEASVIELYKMAVAQDGENGVAVFSADAVPREGDAVSKLTAHFEALPPLPYFEAQISDGEAKVVDDTGRADMGMKDELLSGSPLGRAAQKQKAAEFGDGDKVALVAAAAAKAAVEAMGGNK